MESKVVSTWLSRKVNLFSNPIVAMALLALVVGSIILKYPANYELVFQKGEWWRAWTTLFSHGDEKHLLSNSFFFFLFGSLLTSYFGTFMFPLMAFIFGGLINLVVLLQMPATTFLIGASGVVFWMGGVWLMLYVFLDRRRTIIQRLVRALGVGLVLFMPAEAFDPTVSYTAHLAGFLFGIMWGVIYFLMRKKEFRAAEVLEYDLDYMLEES